MTATRTAAQQVALAAVRDALRSLWRLGCPAEPAVSVTRSLAVNLIAVTTAEDEPDQRALLDHLVRRLPCRAFVVVADGAGDGTARVEGALRPGPHCQEIVLEQVELHDAWAALPALAGAVRPLLVHDLPTHLYWATDWPQPPAPFEALAALCDHVVVDSAMFRAPQRGLDELQRQRQAGRRVTDLTWLRLRPWRRALAEAFERFAFQPWQPTAVRIGHGAAAGDTAAAVALGQWLERRLGAAVQFEPADSGGAGGPERLLLQHGNVEVRIDRGRRGELVVHVTTQSSCHLPCAVAPPRGRTADLLAAAIDLA